MVADESGAEHLQQNLESKEEEEDFSEDEPSFSYLTEAEMNVAKQQELEEQAEQDELLRRNEPPDPLTIVKPYGKHLEDLPLGKVVSLLRTGDIAAKTLPGQAGRPQL